MGKEILMDMRDRYFNIKKSASLFILIINVVIFINYQSVNGQDVVQPIVQEETEVDCSNCDNNCFTSQILEQESADNCITRTIQVNAERCKHALSHFIIEVECGHVTEASNSENWKMELNSRDPKSEIWGLKVDDIWEFGDDFKKDSFTVTYTVCSDNEECIQLMLDEPLLVGYKASTCLYLDTLNYNDESEIPLNAEISATDILCHGDLTGAVSIIIIEGVEPISFLWNTGDTTQNLAGVSAGIYSVVITDFSGQSDTLSAEVVQPEKITIEGTATDVSCGMNNGTIDVLISGGMEPYVFQWSDGDTINLTRNGLSKGSYSLNVTDANGCNVTEIFLLTEDCDEIPLTAEISATDILCYGYPTGTVSVNITEGTEPISYLWSNGATTQNLTRVTAGIYSVTITDSLGQTLELSAEVVQPERIIIDGVVTETSCGNDDGSIEVTISGGKEPYIIEWNDGDSVNLIRSGLGMGSYSLNVTDANGCSASKIFTIKQATDLYVSLSGGSLECHQDGQGELITTVIGGDGPYTYEWTTGDTTATISNLYEGRYEVTVTDINGCIATRGGYVTVKDMTASVSAISPDCEGGDNGSAALTITNGTAPYDIEWSNGDTSSVAENLGAGYYTVNITDVNGCEYSRPVIITDPAPIVINSQVLRTDCSADNGSMYVVLTGSGGVEPYTFYSDSSVINDTLLVEAEGVITVLMTDAKGCSTTDEIEVVYPEQSFNISASVVQPTCDNLTGSVEISATGGLEPYYAVWSDGNNEMSRTDLVAGEYTVVVEDAAGCSSSLTIIIEAPELPSITIVSSDNPNCESDNNTVSVTAENVATISWAIDSDNGDWYIQQDNSTEIIYYAGLGDAIISVVGTSIDGCVAYDTLSISCDDAGDGDDGGDDNGNDDGSDDNDDSGDSDNDNCTFLEDYQVDEIKITEQAGQCVSFKFVISTKGSSEHELSHMVIGVEEGWISDVTNSENWNVESNSADPKSGVYGLKIDDISGFGQDGYDEFEVYFTVCYDDYVPNEFEFPIVFKASTCSLIDTVSVRAYNGGSCIDLDNYPNPFTDDSHFEFDCHKDTHVELVMFDLCGNRVKVLYNGDVQGGVRYKCTFNGKQYKDQMFFYRMITPEETKCGKVIKQ